MENFITQIPTTPYGWFAILTGVLGATVFFFSKVRRDDFVTLRESNQDLRVALADLRFEMDEMKLKIAELESKNGTLHELVNTALQEYFSKNPELAKEYKHALEMTYKELLKRSK